MHTEIKFVKKQFKKMHNAIPTVGVVWFGSF